MPGDVERRRVRKAPRRRRGLSGLRDRVICTIAGHRWAASIVGRDRLGRPIRRRCLRCGDHQYRNLNGRWESFGEDDD